MGGWRLTIRHGPRVEQRSFTTLEQTIEAARAAAEGVRSEGGLNEINALRDFTPADRVHARIEISSPGFFHGRDAGIDVMGDGSLVAYRGFVRRRELPLDGVADAYEALREALAGKDH